MTQVFGWRLTGRNIAIKRLRAGNRFRGWRRLARHFSTPARPHLIGGAAARNHLAVGIGEGAVELEIGAPLGERGRLDALCLVGIQRQLDRDVGLCRALEAQIQLGDDGDEAAQSESCLLYTSPSPRD